MGHKKFHMTIFKSLASVGAIVCRNCRHLVKHQLLRIFCRLINTRAKSVSTAVVSAMLKWSQASQPDGEVYRDCRKGAISKDMPQQFWDWNDGNMGRRMMGWSRFWMHRESGIARVYSSIILCRHLHPVTQKCHEREHPRRKPSWSNMSSYTYTCSIAIISAEIQVHAVSTLKSLSLKNTKILEFRKEN